MKILVIEDDKFFQKFYSTKLAESGYEVYVASDGEEGLNIVPQVNPNLILLDIILPKKDGFEVLASIGQKPELKSIPVIVFSTLGQEQDIERAKKLGAVDFINKSFFDFENLKAKINQFIKK